MNEIVSTLAGVSVKTMSSVELVQIINELRPEGAAELRHDNFVTKIEKHPGIQSPKFLGDYKDSKGRTYKCYHLPKRECELMVMSESLEVQTRVYDRMVELENKPVEVAPNLAPPVAMLSMYLDVARMFEIPLHIAQTEATKEVRLQLGVDFTNMLRLAPAQQNIQAEQIMLGPTEVGKRLGMSAIKLNKELEAAGLQIKVGGSWQPTEIGKKFCTTNHWVSGNKDGYNLKWNVAEVERRLAK